MNRDEEFRLLYQSGKSCREISDITGVPKNTIYANLKRQGVVTRKRGGRVSNLANIPHGSLTPLYQKPGKGVVWICRCICGSEIEVTSKRLTHGGNLHCGCLKDSRHRGYGDILQTYWWFVKYGAETRSLELAISIEDAWELFLRQDGKCALTGIPIVLAKTAKEFNERLQTASLDRIDSSIGYTKSNTQWIHKDVNRLKSDFSESELFKWCKVIYEHNRLSENGCTLLVESEKYS